MVDCRLLVVSNVVEDYTKVDVSKELASDVSNLLVFVVEVNSLFVVVGGVSLSELHIVNTDAVVGECLAMHITDCLAYLEKPLVLFNRLLVFPEIVEQDACRVVGTALISGLARTLAGEGKDVVVLQTLLGCNSVV